MSKEKVQTTEKIVQITLEILQLLTGEDYIVVKKQRDNGAEGSMVPPTNFQDNEQKIVDLANMIIQILSEEVPLKCESVHVQLSIEQQQEDQEPVDEQTVEAEPQESVSVNPEILTVTETDLRQSVSDHQYVEETIGNEETFAEVSVECSVPEPENDIIYSEGCVEEDGIAQDYQIEQGDEMFHVQCKDNELVTEIRTDLSVSFEAQPETPEITVSVPEFSVSEEIVAEELSGATIIGHNLSAEGLKKYVVIQGHDLASHGEIILTDATFDHAGILSTRFKKHKSGDVKAEEVPDKKPKRRRIKKNFDDYDCTVDDGERTEDITECVVIYTDHTGLVTQSVENSSDMQLETQHVCPDCGKSFLKSSYLAAHRRIHTGDKPFVCSDCGKCFSNNRSLIAHQRIHTGERPFSCKDCGKSFVQLSSLLSHRRVHTGEKPFLCSDCGKCFKERASLIRHHRIHTGEKPFICPECGRGFNQITHLVTHQNVYGGECGKPPELRKNASNRNDPEKNRFVCPECGKCFSQNAYLSAHLKIHKGEKPFMCADCGKCFSKNRNLIIHQRIHTGERPFSCTECGKTFNQVSSLLSHRRIHTGERPYSCTQCGKGFKVKSSLVRHYRVHTGEKPFPCSECGKCFTQMPHLITHQKIHIRDKS